VSGNLGACLILVANGNGTFVDQGENYFDAAAWFFAGLSSPTTPVIIATGDEIRLEQYNNANVTTEVAYLSLYARFAFLMGAQVPRQMLLHHAVPYSFDTLIDRLTAQNVLPGSEQLVPSLQLAVGSWQEVGR